MNDYEEQIKYKKKKPSSISRADKKSKHKHEYKWYKSKNKIKGGMNFFVQYENTRGGFLNDEYYFIKKCIYCDKVSLNYKWFLTQEEFERIKEEAILID